jgi:hypothetical protein
VAEICDIDVAGYRYGDSGFLQIEEEQSADGSETDQYAMRQGHQRSAGTQDVVPEDDDEGDRSHHYKGHQQDGWPPQARRPPRAFQSLDEGRQG